MGVGNTTTSTLTTAIPAEWISAFIIEEARPHNVIAPLVARYTLGQGEGLTFKPQIRPTTVAAAVAEGSDISATARTTTEGSITASEVGLGTNITDKASRSAKVAGDIAGWAASQGRAMGQKLTGDLAALFAALNSSSAVGTSGTNMTVLDFIEAMYTLDNADAPGAKKCVLHPRQVADLFGALIGTGAVYQNLPELIREGRLPGGTPMVGFQGMLFGVPVWSTTEVDAVNSDADVAGAMFTEEAMGVVWQQGVTTEYDRDASARSTEVIVVATYGVAEVIDTYGVPIETDA